jgi:hypothetical protein
VSPATPVTTKLRTAVKNNALFSFGAGACISYDSMNMNAQKKRKKITKPSAKCCLNLNQ